eukprot:jgi/Bigna1/60831/fgenesh1_kg.15_\
MSSKNPKKRKRQQKNFFEKLKVEDLKDLLKAVNMKVSGTKKELIARLLNHEFTKDFANEGPILQKIKRLLKVRGLRTSGKRIDLIIRLG